ncbi:MAG: class GN sortase [Thermoanaerobaculia bacterium]
MRRRITSGSIVVIVIALIGFALAGRGGWIFVKARFAQVLLERSWQQSLRGVRDARPWPWADTWPIARLRIPGRNVNFIVLSGASGRTMAFGPGHIDGTAMPGESGNCVISGHRDTQFRMLKDLATGDRLELQSSDGVIGTYHVIETRVVNKSHIELLRQSGPSRITLITCYPFDALVPGGPLRYVVVALKEGEAEGRRIARR